MRRECRVSGMVFTHFTALVVGSPRPTVNVRGTQDLDVGGAGGADASGTGKPGVLGGVLLGVRGTVLASAPHWAASSSYSSSSSQEPTIVSDFGIMASGLQPQF